MSGFVRGPLFLVVAILLSDFVLLQSTQFNEVRNWLRF